MRGLVHSVAGADTTGFRQFSGTGLDDEKLPDPWDGNADNAHPTEGRIHCRHDGPFKASKPDALSNGSVGGVAREEYRGALFLPLDPPRIPACRSEKSTMGSAEHVAVCGAWDG